jgi:hypothetical protein
VIKFTKPEQLNGSQLRKELRDAGVEIRDGEGSILIDGDKMLCLDITKSYEAQAAAVVAAHIGNTVALELTVAEKLASVGLSLEELKAALGGN